MSRLFLMPTRLGLSDRIDRAAPRSFLQLEFCNTVGMDLCRECVGKRGVDGGDVVLSLATGRLSLAVDAQLGRAHCY